MRNKTYKNYIIVLKNTTIILFFYNLYQHKLRVNNGWSSTSDVVHALYFEKEGVYRNCHNLRYPIHIPFLFKISKLTVYRRFPVVRSQPLVTPAYIPKRDAVDKTQRIAEETNVLEIVCTS